MKTSNTGKCVICTKKYTKFGHNAEPVKKGRCCNRCNDMSVIPQRLIQAWKKQVESNYKKIII